MSMNHKFDEGKYPGKTVAQVACMDYLHLKSIYDYGGTQDPQLKAGIEEAISLMNNFVPRERCAYDYNQAEFMSIKIKHVKKYNPFFGKDIDSLDSVIMNPVCSQDNIDCHEIKFNVLEDYSREPKLAIKKIQEALMDYAGWQPKDRMTPKNCYNFIKTLVPKK